MFKVTNCDHEHHLAFRCLEVTKCDLQFAGLIGDNLATSAKQRVAARGLKCYTARMGLVKTRRLAAMAAKQRAKAGMKLPPQGAAKPLWPRPRKHETGRAGRAVSVDIVN